MPDRPSIAATEARQAPYRRGLQLVVERLVRLHHEVLVRSADMLDEHAPATNAVVAAKQISSQRNREAAFARQHLVAGP
jgi:hypothetical protein